MNVLPGTYDTHYHYSGPASLAYLYGRGHRVVRFPFLWERIQRSLGGELDATELARLNAYISNAGNAGLKVILDVRSGTTIGAAGGPTIREFVDLWTRLSAAFGTNDAVLAYGLMNKPQGLSSWQAASQAAVTAIRENDDTKLIMVAGSNGSGVADWTENNPTPWITDPVNNVRYEAHHYFDRDHSGAYANTYSAEVAHALASGWLPTSVRPDALISRVLTELENFKGWLSAHGVDGFISEMGWPKSVDDDTSWNTLGAHWYVSADKGSLWVTYWSAGEWWESYDLALYGTDSFGVMASPSTQEATVLAHPSRT